VQRLSSVIGAVQVEPLEAALAPYSRLERSAFS